MSLLHRTRSTDGELPELTPEQRAELDALDAALAGEDIADAGLVALVRDMRAAAPELGSSGAQRVKEQLKTSLGSAAAGGGAKRRRLRLPLGSPAAGFAAMLIVLVLGGGTIALFAGGSQRGGDEAITKMSDAATPASDAAGSAEANSASSAASEATAAAPGASGRESATEMAASAGPSAADASPKSSSESAPPNAAGLGGLSSTPPSDRTTGRAVERTVDLAVRVKSGELQEAAGKVNGITREANGYIASSDLSLGREGAGSASFELRVDSSRLDRAIDRLSELGTVTGQDESSRDITSSLDSAKTRVADARKEREALLAALKQATTAGEIASLKAQIAENRRQLASLDAALQRVQRRADLTTISLRLAAPGKGDPSADDGNWGLADAAGDAWGAFRAIIGGILVAAAVIAPFVLLGAAGYAVWLRRRRAARERALDT